MLEKATKGLPIISVMIITTGIIKTILYYTFFNLPIKYFLGLTEIGILVADDLMISLSLTALTFLVFYITQINLPENFENNDESKGLSRKTLQSIHIILISMPIIMAILATFLFDDIYFIGGTYPMFLILVILEILSMSQKWKSTLKVKENSDFIKVLLITSLTISIVLFTNSAEYYDVKNKGKYKGTIVQTDLINHISNDSIFFIGKTDKYIFIHNKKDKSNEIISMNDVKRFVLKSN